MASSPQALVTSTSTPASMFLRVRNSSFCRHATRLDANASSRSTTTSFLKTNMTTIEAREALISHNPTHTYNVTEELWYHTKNTEPRINLYRITCFINDDITQIEQVTGP